MKKPISTIILSIAILGMTLSLANAKELTNIRIGWETSRTTQGQLIQALKLTDILKKNGLNAIFKGSTNWPVLNKTALADGIDVIFTTDQSAAKLFSKNVGWIGVGRLMYSRALTYVHPNSPINSLEELRGKTIGIPLGTAAERVTIVAIKKAGLDPKKDVKIIDLGIREQGPLVMGLINSANWANIDALSGVDPTSAIFETKGLIKVVDVGKVCSLVLMNETFIMNNPGIAEKLMQAIFDAYKYYRDNTEKLNTRFMKETGQMGADQKSCDLAASIEPNVWVKSRKDIRVTFIEEDYRIMRDAAEFMAPKIKEKIDMRKYVTDKYARAAK